MQSSSGGPGGQAPGSSEDLAVNCIKNGPKIHPRGAYCLITFTLYQCIKDNVVLQALHPSRNYLYTKSKSTMLWPMKGEAGYEYELSTSKLSNSDSSAVNARSKHATRQIIDSGAMK